jgi:predicted nucleic acid-binding protein
MIVLDTNVLSEPLRPQPEAGVISWLRQVKDTSVTVVSVAEMLVGARTMPQGERREGLLRAIEQVLVASSHVLPYDEKAAREYARMQEDRRAAGRPLSVEDGMIAAICATQSATLATRNVRDFQGLGLALINPWELDRHQSEL